jgi:hypothetical protein
MSNIIVNDIDFNFNNILLKKFKFNLNYYNVRNCWYGLNKNNDFLIYNLINFTITLAVLIFSYFFISNYSMKIIYNSFFYFWLIFLIIEIYTIINYFTRYFFKIYDENMFKFNLFRYMFFIDLIVIITLFYIFPFNYYHLIIIISKEIFFFIFLIFKIIIKCVEYIFLYLISISINYTNNISYNEKILIKRLCHKNIIFTDKRFLYHKDIKIINNNLELGLDKCCICFDNFKENEKIVKLSCNHYFHQICLLNWIFIRRNCPICRSNFLNND